jgi:hypothetical protein
VTATEDADGAQAYHRYNSADNSVTWADGMEVRFIEAE